MVLTWWTEFLMKWPFPARPIPIPAQSLFMMRLFSAWGLASSSTQKPYPVLWEMKLARYRPVAPWLTRMPLPTVPLIWLSNTFGGEQR